MNDFATLPQEQAGDAAAKQAPSLPAQPQAPAPAAPGHGEPDPKAHGGRLRWAMGLCAAVLVLVAGLTAWGVWGHARRGAAAQATLRQLQMEPAFQPRCFGPDAGHVRQQARWQVH